MPWPVHPTGFFGAQGDNDTYQIERSLRFNSADSAYLSRTPASAGNRKTWTWSGWVKRGLQSADHVFFGNTDGSGYNGLYFQFTSTNKIQIGDYGVGSWDWQIVTTPVYRDSSAWYHIVATVDTTQVTASNRVKIYVNGTQVTSLDTSTYPSLNSDLRTNTTQLAAIGRLGSYNGFYFDGYLTEINFIDGQALTPSDFGETDALTGRWKAKAYSGGSYGTNGFYLKFADNSGATATTLGKDSSGNGNNWTPNNFSVTAGAGNDSLVDSPTNYGSDSGIGGELRGNYATLNQLSLSYGTLSNGSLSYVGNGVNHDMIISTIAQSSGKWYCEVILTNSVSTDQFSMLGVVNLDYYTPKSSPTYPGGNLNSWGYYPDDGAGPGIYNNGSLSDALASSGTNDIIGVALDCDSGTASWYKNNSLLITKTIGYGNWAFVVGHVNANCSVNFGQRPFAYTAPTGFKALCTTNLSKDTAITTSGSFTGNASADGPFVWLNGTPTATTINGNAVTFQTHVDKLANGFKVRTSSASYNASGSNTFSVSTTESKFKYARAQAN